MASAPNEIGPVGGRVDRECRLLWADPELEALQVDAGSAIGAELAIPQVAAVARLALRLGVPLARPAVVAGADRDIELWVRASPSDGGVDLSLERWRVRPPAPSRLGGHFAADADSQSAGGLGSWTTDGELRLQSLSHPLAEKASLSDKEIAGQPLTRIFRLEEDEDGGLPLIAGIASRSDFSGQRARLRAADNVVLILSGSAVSDRDGRFVGYRGTAVEEGAEPPNDQHPEIRQDFGAALDEALRSPLDRIIGSADRIVQQTEGPLRSDYADYASDIAAAARHLLSVVRTMGAEDDRRDFIDLAQLSADAAGLIESAAEARDVRVVLTSTDPLMAQGEGRGVIQILVNLIGNAVRHSPSGGAVTVSVEQSADGALVHVVDDGPGIDPADQQRIFERFEQGRPGEGGAGLGLAIARRLARAMGGDVKLQSTPGQGARFTLSLPTH